MARVFRTHFAFSSCLGCCRLSCEEQNLRYILHSSLISIMEHPAPTTPSSHVYLEDSEIDELEGLDEFEGEDESEGEDEFELEMPDSDQLQFYSSEFFKSSSPGANEDDLPDEQREIRYEQVGPGFVQYIDVYPAAHLVTLTIAEGTLTPA